MKRKLLIYAAKLIAEFCGFMGFLYEKSGEYRRSVNKTVVETLEKCQTDIQDLTVYVESKNLSKFQQISLFIGTAFYFFEVIIGLCIKVVPKKLFVYLMRTTLPLSNVMLFVVHLFIESLRRTRHNEAAITQAPGAKLLRAATFIFSKITVDNVFRQIVADLREEYYDSLKNGEKWRAKWIRIKYGYLFFVSMLKCSPIGDLIELLKLRKNI